MAKANYLILVVVVIISLLFGFFLGKISEQKIWQEKLVKTQEEIDWLKSQLEMFYSPLPEEIYSVSGTVAEVGDKFLVMEAQIRVSQFPLPEGKEIEKRNIKVNVSGETEVFQLEMAEPPLLEAPLEPFKKATLSFEEIKTGDSITVISEENIKGKKEITASQIELYY